jgi:hypothetical protein
MPEPCSPLAAQSTSISSEQPSSEHSSGQREQVAFHNASFGRMLTTTSKYKFNLLGESAWAVFFRHRKLWCVCGVVSERFY